MSAARAGDPTPAKAKNWLSRHYAGTVAVFREAGSASTPAFSIGDVLNWFSKTKRDSRRHQSGILGHQFTLPPLGAVLVVLAYFISIIVMCFYDLSPSNRWSYESVAMRVGHVSAVQVPLIVLLAGRNNLVGFVAGLSHDRLNWLHRWVSRCLWVTATIHFSYWLVDWAPYGNFAVMKIRTDPLTTRGFATWIILTWIVFGSSRPLRSLGYEVFVAAHVLSFVGFLVVLYFHVPQTVRFVIWMSVGFVCFDRAVRLLRLFYLNSPLFRRSKSANQKDKESSSGLLACRATFTRLEHETTRVTIVNPPLQSWRPGQHVFLSCPGVAFLQAHPFTVASLPEDGKMEFFVKAHTGATRRFLQCAYEEMQDLPMNRSQTIPKLRPVAIEGPYGCIRPPEQFDTVVLFAGATGATFCVPILRDIVSRWKSMYSTSPGPAPKSGLNSAVYVPGLAVTKRIRFVWAVKSRFQLGWFSRQLTEAAETVERLSRQPGVPELELSISVYVTCDDSYVGDHERRLEEGQPGPSAVANRAPPMTLEKRLDLGDRESRTSALDDAQMSPVEAEKCCCTEPVGDESAAAGRAECTCASNGGETSGCGGGGGGGNRLSKVAPDQEPDSPSSAVDSPDTVVPTSPQRYIGRTNTDMSDNTATAVGGGVVKPALSLEQQPVKDRDGAAARPDQFSDVVYSPLQSSFSSNPIVGRRIRVLTGRPVVREILIPSLEQATGETAVMACGPRGLMADARAATVKLSDERAAGRSTGAMGIWFYGEGFQY